MHAAVIIPYLPRPDTGLLLWTLEGYRAQQLAPGHTFEILVGVDGTDIEPVSPDVGGPVPVIKIFPHMGAAAVRNALVAAVSPKTELLLFGNADARPDPAMVQTHMNSIAALPPQSLVLGSAPWAAPFGRPMTVMDAFIAETPVIFFYPLMKPRTWHDYTSCWSLNLSIRKNDFFAAGGFNERLRPVFYEDLTMGYQLLGKRKGVWYEPAAKVLHRHPMRFEEYLDREEMLGIMAPVFARVCPGGFAGLFQTDDVTGLVASFRIYIQQNRSGHKSVYERIRPIMDAPASSIGEGVYRGQFLWSLLHQHMELKRFIFRLGFLRGMELLDDEHWQLRRPQGRWRQALGVGD